MPYDSMAINQLLGTTPVDDFLLDTWMANLDYKQIIRTPLSFLGERCKNPSTYNVFAEKYMLVNPAMWYAF